MLAQKKLNKIQILPENIKKNNGGGNLPPCQVYSMRTQVPQHPL